jgi:hypothetical protein
MRKDHDEVHMVFRPIRASRDEKGDAAAVSERAVLPFWLQAFCIPRAVSIRRILVEKDDIC